MDNILTILGYIMTYITIAGIPHNNHLHSKKQKQEETTTKHFGHIHP